MKIGKLFIGWCLLSESERIELGLDPVVPGWEGLCVEWADRGFMIVVRPLKAKTRRP